LRAQASSRGPNDFHIAAGGGLTATLDRQVQSVVSVLAEAGPSAAYPDLSSFVSLPSLPGATLVPPALIAIVGRIAASGVLHSPQMQEALLVQRQSPIPVTILDGDSWSLHLSTQMTVGQALSSAGITIGRRDIVSPDPDTSLAPGLTIRVQYAARVDLGLNGVRWVEYSHAATVAEFLKEIGVEIGPMDRVSPGLAEPLDRQMRIDVTTVYAVINLVELPVPFDTIYWSDPDLLQGESALVQTGSAGLLRRAYLIQYENGIAVSRTRIGETTVPPTDQIIALGTKVIREPELARSDGQACVETMDVFATWYTAASSGGSGITFTGTAVYKGIVAVDPQVIPLGTRMYIPGYGYGLAADTGGGIIGAWIDLGYGPDDVYDWATGRVEICILG
ncbi:MAG: G5 domain-containing protein, partial [Dehalococcoidia bacterium]